MYRRNRSFKEKASELFVKIFATVLGAVDLFIPTELYFLIRWVAEPEGFWQELALAGVGLFFLGFIQLVLAFAFIYWLFMVWDD